MIRTTNRTTARAFATPFVIAGAIAVCASPMIAGAQRTGRDSSDAFLEMHWNVGMYIPVGQQSHALTNAPYYQLSALAVPVREVALVASAGWAPTHDQERTGTSVEVIDLDGGLEVRRAKE